MLSQQIANTAVHYQLLHQCIAIIAEAKYRFLILFWIKNYFHFIVAAFWLFFHFLDFKSKLLNNFGN